jgi:acetyl esterase/lipase
MIKNLSFIGLVIDRLAPERHGHLAFCAVKATPRILHSDRFMLIVSWKKTKGRKPSRMDGFSLIGLTCLRLLWSALLTGVLFASAGLSPGVAANNDAQTDTSKLQVEALIGFWRQDDLATDNLRERRKSFEKLMQSTPEPTRIQTKHIDADGVAADMILPARLHHPYGNRAILYLHGGGFYSGSIRTHRALAAALAKGASADVLLVDYRLVPEYTYPVQIQDVLTAYRWLLKSGYRNDNIVIVGDSVGGNLAIEMTLRQIQANGPLPAAVVAMSPVTDLAATGASMTKNAGTDPLVNKAQILSLSKAYLGKQSPSDPQASPLYANLAGFPPLLLQVGSREVLLDDTLRLAENARKAGVDVTAEVWPGMIHQWQLFPFWLDDARRSNQRVADYLIDHFADKPEE